METLKNYVDWKLAHSDKIANAEGYPCILKKSKKGNLKELVIEGNTKSKNIIPYPYTELKSSATESGITFTPNPDGTITLNGTATKNVFQRITSFTLPKGFYHFNGVIDGYSETTYQCYLENTTLNKYLYNQSFFYLDRECEIVIFCCVYKDTSVENLTFSFIIQACNDNMLPMRTFSKTIARVTYTGDSSLPYIRLNGTKYGQSLANIFTDLNITLSPDKKYVICAVINGLYQYLDDTAVKQTPAIRFAKADGTGIQYVKLQDNENTGCVSSLFTVSEDTIINRFSFALYSNNVKYENFDVIVGLYEYSTEYEPYKAVGEASKNLMKYPHLFGKSVTHNGVTFTIDANGVVTINGTPKGVGQCNIDARNFLKILDSTKDYILSGVVEPNYNSDGSYAKCQINMVFSNKGSFVKNIAPVRPDFSTRINLSKVTEEFNECHIQILVYGNIPDKVKFYPQIEEGTKRTKWCPNGKYRIPLIVSGKNLFNGYGFSAQGMITPTASRVLSNNVGTTISTTSPSNTLTVTQSKVNTPDTPNDYRNGYFCIGLNEDIKIGKKYRFYCDAEITNNPLNVSTFDLAPNNQMLGYGARYNNGKLSGTFFYKENGNRRFLELRNRGCNMTISNIMITESDINDTVYEPFLNLITTNIYLDNPLGSRECLDFKRQKLIKPTSQTDVALPKVQVFKGTSVIRTDTEVSPTNIKAKYIKY